MFEGKQSTCAMALLALGIAAARPAAATENFDLRYAPGSGGGDMSLPLDPGAYFQVPFFVYHGKFDSKPSQVVLGAPELFGGPLASLAGALPSAVATTPVRSAVTIDARVLLPRWTYMSAQRLLGATVGVSAMVPVLQKRADVHASAGSTSISGVDPTMLAGLTGGALSTDALASGVNVAVTSQADASAASASGKRFGAGDLEIAPVLRWSDAVQQLIFAPTLVLPTGKYDKTRPVNPGAGDFYTLRPTLQYGYIGDGWDVGARTAVSLNSRNRDTGYRSGTYWNLDLAAMHSFTDGLRAGLTGYAVVQSTRDRMDGAPNATQAATLGQRGRVFGVGPGMAWLKGDGDFLLDARALKEFDAANRPKGSALWINLSWPLR